jgi:hypothetical protein
MPNPITLRFVIRTAGLEARLLAAVVVRRLNSAATKNERQEGPTLAPSVYATTPR